MSIVTYIKDKLGVKHEIGAKWDNVSGKPSTFAPSAHNHNASDINAGTLPIARGGTGATTRIGAEYNLLSGVESIDGPLEDARLFPIKNNTVSASNGVFRWFSLSRLWEYVKGKLTGADVNVGGNASTASALKPFWKKTSGAGQNWFRYATINCGSLQKDYSGVTGRYAAWRQYRATFLMEGRYTGSCEIHIRAEIGGSADVPDDVDDAYNYYITKCAIFQVFLIGAYLDTSRHAFKFRHGPVKSDGTYNIYLDCWGNMAEYNTTSVYVLGVSDANVSPLTDTTTYTAITTPDNYYVTPATGTIDKAGTNTFQINEVIPRTNNSGNVGSSSNKWANVYATNFNGALKGNADTASNCNYSGKAEANTLVVKRTNTSGGAFIQYLPNNQTENWWRTGSVQDSSKFVFNYKGTDKAFIDTNGAYNGDVKGNASTASAAKSGSALETAINGKADAASVTGATKCKVTYNGQGVITAGADLDASDIPNLAASKITSGTFADERIASASKWNAKQDALTFDTTPTESSSNPVTSAGVKSYVDSAVTGLYKYRGSVNTDYINALQNPLNGDVYNINTSGTITNGEGGQPMSVLAGDNVAFVLDPITSTTYWDKMSSELDLSNFVDFDDIATATTAGVVKSSSTNGKVSVDASGVMTVNGWSGKQNTLTEMTPEEVTNLIGALKEYGSTYINE